MKLNAITLSVALGGCILFLGIYITWFYKWILIDRLKKYLMRLNERIDLCDTILCTKMLLQGLFYK